MGNAVRAVAGHVVPKQQIRTEAAVDLDGAQLGISEAYKTRGVIVVLHIDTAHQPAGPQQVVITTACVQVTGDIPVQNGGGVLSAFLFYGAIDVSAFHQEVIAAAALLYPGIDRGAGAVDDLIGAAIEYKIALNGAVIVDGGVSGTGNEDLLINKGAGLIENAHGAVARNRDTYIEGALIDDLVVAAAGKGKGGIDIAVLTIGNRVIAVADQEQAVVDIAGIDKINNGIVL